MIIPTSISGSVFNLDPRGDSPIATPYRMSGGTLQGKLGKRWPPVDDETDKPTDLPSPKTPTSTAPAKKWGAGAAAANTNAKSEPAPAAKKWGNTSNPNLGQSQPVKVFLTFLPYGYMNFKNRQLY